MVQEDAHVQIVVKVDGKGEAALFDEREATARDIGALADAPLPAPCLPYCEPPRERMRALACTCSAGTSRMRGAMARMSSMRAWASAGSMVLGAAYSAMTSQRPGVCGQPSYRSMAAE